jgi:hypothetical protein
MSQAPCRKRSVHAGPSLSFLCVAVRYNYRGRSCSRRRDSHLTFHNLRESGLRGMGCAAVTVSRYDKVRSVGVALVRLPGPGAIPKYPPAKPSGPCGRRSALPLFGTPKTSYRNRTGIRFWSLSHGRNTFCCCKGAR